MYSGTAEKIEKIKEVVKESKNGLWIQELARKCGLHSGSVCYLINRYLPEFEFQKIAKGERVTSLITFVKLK